MSYSLWEQLHPPVLRVTKTISFEKAHLVMWHNNDSGWATLTDSSSRYKPLLLVHYCERHLALTDDILALLPQNQLWLSLSCWNVRGTCQDLRLLRVYSADTLLPAASTCWRICSLLRQNTRQDLSKVTRNVHIESLLSIPDKISSTKWNRAGEQGWMAIHLSW